MQEENSQIVELVNGLLHDFKLSKPPASKGAKKKANEDDFFILLRAFADVQRRLNSLEIERDELKAKVRLLESKTTSTGSNKNPSSYASKAASPGSDFSAAVVKAIATNAKLAANRATNVVVVGVSESSAIDPKVSDEHDLAEAVSIIQATGALAQVKSVRRMRPSGNGRKQSTSSNPIPLIVELSSEIEKESVLNSARNLGKSERFKKVFIRKDRTPDEQNAYVKLCQEQRAANADLQSNGKLDQPFRFVVRGDRVKCIDVSKKDNLGRHPYVEWNVACSARKRTTQPSPSSTTAERSE